MADETRIDVRELAARATADRAAASLLRTRAIVEPIDATHAVVGGQRLINFSSNDYLGLTHHPGVCESVARAAATSAGAGAAPLITGRTHAHERAERAIAEWKGVDDAVLLPSGFQANHSAIGALAGLASATGRRVRFIADKLAHASLIDAIATTGTELRIVPHNGLAKLERLVAEREADRLDVFVTESIFSMDGDAADLRAIVELRRRHGFALVLDEAHATGVIGDDGAGLARSLGLSDEVDLGIATCSKALGVVGGAVYGSRAMIAAVVNFGRAYIYSTSVPAFVAEGVTAAVAVARAARDRRERLRLNVERLRSALTARGIEAIAGESPIVPIVLGDEAAALAASHRLREAGYLVIAVRPPTVPRGTSRLRVTLSSEHTADEVDGLLEALSRVVA